MCHGYPKAVTKKKKLVRNYKKKNFPLFPSSSSWNGHTPFVETLVETSPSHTAGCKPLASLAIKRLFNSFLFKSIFPIQIINPINPIQTINPMETINPIQPINPINPIQTFNPIQTINPIQIINPIQTINPIQILVKSSTIYLFSYSELLVLFVQWFNSIICSINCIILNGQFLAINWLSFLFNSSCPALLISRFTYPALMLSTCQWSNNFIITRQKCLVIFYGYFLYVLYHCLYILLHCLSH
eukprot:1013402_1